MARRLIVAAFAVAIVTGIASPALAQVNVNIGVNLPAPPQLVPIPSTPIQYAPAVSANYFFYGGEYYVFDNGQWYVSSGYNGPWVALAPEFVPVPLLQVPVRYYHRPPAAWRAWHREAPPQWAPAWGRRWQERHHGGMAQPRFERREEPRFEPRSERRDDRRDERREERHDERRDRR